MTQHEQRRLKDAQGLFYIHQFGWLRTAELGRLLWPDLHTSRPSADRLARDWVARNLVIVRNLPDGAGRALVLAAAGVRLLAEHGVPATTGKDIGRFTSQGWLPPSTWRHDLLATGVLCELNRRGFVVHPEAELRRRAGRAAKIPDGIATKGNQVLWVEIECARKTGPEMRKMAEALSLVARGLAGEVAGFKPTAAMVGFVPGVLDERGYALSHQKRVRRAVQLVTPVDLSMYWAECRLLGAAGVGEVTFSLERVHSDRAGAILRRLDLSGWRSQDDGSLSATYDSHIVYVWENGDVEQWSYAVESMSGTTIEAGYTRTLTEAKRAAAGTLARVCARK